MNTDLPTWLNVGAASSIVAFVMWLAWRYVSEVWIPSAKRRAEQEAETVKRREENEAAERAARTQLIVETSQNIRVISETLTELRDGQRSILESVKDQTPPESAT